MVASTCFKKGESGNKKGRPPGIKDKRTKYKAVREQLDEQGFNPILAMINIARDESHPIHTRRQATKDLMDKAYPDLRAIDIQSSDRSLDEVVALKEEMKELLSNNTKEY